ncbi:peptidoglycan-binding protein [Roseobacter sp. YSTF-M11]|uniref:Peptidoglycan-binding protein n=1 Tax=Roseobacter insulae TaxID=2859783 RepID=A0A9X1FZH1_9RHOB|nr:peptidoglycan-binding domain-containing protein [Roseobacter insulae]MBW4710237.1 peptidoglycan-binding protein [Roseobacter insulae]
MTQARHFRTANILCVAAGLLYLLTACTPAAPVPEAASLSPLSNRTAPETAEPGTCWDKTVTPAVVETVTERVLISPADISPEGLIRQPARYRNEERPRIAQPRQERWYQLVCPEDLTSEFTENLQRALAARGYHSGAITGEIDTETRDAIAKYQTAQALPGFDLTTKAAEQLGLIRATLPQ